jgi:hypothetical protein
MNRMSISAATIALALFGLMSVGWAGEMKAKMEEMKGDTKAKVEEMKGEAKAAVEEAKGNKVQAEVERAKGKGNAADGEGQGQGQGTESEDGIGSICRCGATGLCMGMTHAQAARKPTA